MTYNRRWCNNSQQNTVKFLNLMSRLIPNEEEKNLLQPWFNRNSYYHALLPFPQKPNCFCFVLLCFVSFFFSCSFKLDLFSGNYLEKSLQFSWLDLQKWFVIASFLGLRKSDWPKVIQLVLCLRWD